MCHDNCVIHISRLISNINKKVDFDFDYYDEKTCQILEGQSIATKDTI